MCRFVMLNCACPPFFDLLILVFILFQEGHIVYYTSTEVFLRKLESYRGILSICQPPQRTAAQTTTTTTLTVLPHVGAFIYCTFLAINKIITHCDNVKNCTPVVDRLQLAMAGGSYYTDPSLTAIGLLYRMRCLRTVGK